MGVRVVWQLDLPDISGTHLHPADTRGAIVSLDRADPPGLVALGRSGLDRARRNRSAGAAARRDDRRERPGRDGRRAGASYSASSPTARLELDGSFVRFEQGDEERLTEVHLEVPGRHETHRDRRRAVQARRVLTAECWLQVI